MNGTQGPVEEVNCRVEPLKCFKYFNKYNIQKMILPEMVLLMSYYLISIFIA
jgi:hypothetical protein